MNILIDTNIFIYFEDFKIIDESFTKLYNLCNKYKHNFFIHPASIEDINKDSDFNRKNISISKTNKYSMLDRVPIPSKEDLELLGLSEKNDNDRIDNLILFALYKNSVNILLTEDAGILKKARILGIDHRVMYVQQALHSFNKLHLQYEVDYPDMTKRYLYELNYNDEIFDSLKEDYKEFSEWFESASSEQRECWVHGYSNDKKIGGVLIYKEEENEIITNDNKGLAGKIFKISTFKIAEFMQGLKLGELFIKTAFTYANKNRYNYIYLTTRKDKQEYLVNLLEDFGFYHYGICNKNRDDVYVKEIPFNSIINGNLNSMEFHKRYSPFIKCSNIRKFVIPIQPQYHDILFPEIEDNRRLFYTHPSAGNTIKKAYLSHANTNQIESGDLVLFYRSKDKMAITSIGIVEKTFKSKDLDTILEEVAKRTVYSYTEIQQMALKETNIILFRLIDHFEAPYITKEWMEKENIYKNCQSICQIEDDIFNKIVKKGNLNYCISQG